MSMEEAVNRIQESKGVEEVTAMKDVQSTEMEGGFVMCEHTEEIGEEQRPARIKAPPQKRRAVIRLESAEAQDPVSGQQGLEELDTEEMDKLSFIPSAVSEPWAQHMCDNKCNQEGF